MVIKLDPEVEFGTKVIVLVQANGSDGVFATTPKRKFVRPEIRIFVLEITPSLLDVALTQILLRAVSTSRTIIGTVTAVSAGVV